MKWCVIGHEINPERYEFLAKWLERCGLPNTVDFIEISPQELSLRIPDLQANYDQIRIEQPYRHEIYLETKKNEAAMLLVRSADCFFKDDRGLWWLRSPLHHGMNQILNSIGHNLNLDGAALIVGVGGAARSAVASLVKVGYRQFNIANAFDDQAIELVAELRKIYFSVTFQFVSQGQLVLLPGTSSIVVNATPFLQNNDILDELHYFNFLMRGGLVWDLTIRPYETPLTKEAVEIGARVFRGYEFAVATDEVWVRWVAPKLNFQSEKYASEFQDLLKTKTEV